MRELEPRHLAAAAALADLSPAEALALHAVQRNQRLHEIEEAKDHPLRQFALPPEEWAQLCAYLTDGGGVVHDHDLRRTLHQALLSGDQTTFWPTFAHWFKSRLKTMGNIEALPNGGVMHSGVTP